MGIFIVLLLTAIILNLLPHACNNFSPLPKILPLNSCALDAHAVYAHLYERTLPAIKKKTTTHNVGPILLDGHSQGQCKLFA